MTDPFGPAGGGHGAIRRDLTHGMARTAIATADDVNRAPEAARLQIDGGTDPAVAEGDPAVLRYRPMEKRHGTLGAAPGVFPKRPAGVRRIMDRAAGAVPAGGRTGSLTPLSLRANSAAALPRPRSRRPKASISLLCLTP